MELSPIKLRIKMRAQENSMEEPRAENEGAPISPHNETIEDMQQKLTSMDKGIVGIHGELGNINKRIDTLDAKVAGIEEGNKSIIKREPVVIYGAVATLINAAVVYFGQEQIDPEILIPILAAIYGTALAGARSQVSPSK